MRPNQKRGRGLSPLVIRALGVLAITLMAMTTPRQVVPASRIARGGRGNVFQWLRWSHWSTVLTRCSPHEMHSVLCMAVHRHQVSTRARGP